MSKKNCTFAAATGLDPEQDIQQAKTNLIKQI